MSEAIAAEPYSLVVGHWKEETYAIHGPSGHIASGVQPSAARAIVDELNRLSRPAPAVQVPKEWISEIVGGEFDEMTAGQGFRRGWNECRAKMLGILAATPAAAAPTPATVATEAVAQELANGHLPDCAWNVYERQAPCNCYDRKKVLAQGGGVDVEKVMALVQEFGEQCEATGYLDRSGSQDAAKRLHDAAYQTAVKIRALLSASPAGVGGVHLPQWAVDCLLNVRQHGVLSRADELNRVTEYLHSSHAAPAIAKQGEGE